MKNRKKLKKAMYVSTVMWIVLASTFLLMKPIVESTSSKGRVLVAVLGLAFWCSLLMGIVFQAKAVNHYRKICKEEKVQYKGCPGVLRFFSNPIATVADIGMIVSLVIGAVLLRYPTDKLYFYFLEMFLLTLSTSMHCIWNGKMMRMLHSGKIREDR